MKKTALTKTVALVTSAGLAGMLGLSLAAPAAANKGGMTDCPGGGMLMLQLEREGRQWEADIELMSGPRERWTVTISQNGRVTHTVTKKTNRDGEFDFWRYLPGRSGTVDVRATSSTGETCSIRLRA